MYQIEKNVPLPAIVRREANTYPFAEMDVNDSFFVANPAPVDETEEAKTAAEALAKGIYNSLSRAKGEHGKKLERKFAIRKVEGGLRVWRTA